MHAHTHTHTHTHTHPHAHTHTHTHTPLLVCVYFGQFKRYLNHSLVFLGGNKERKNTHFTLTAFTVELLTKNYHNKTGMLSPHKHCSLCSFKASKNRTTTLQRILFWGQILNSVQSYSNFQEE